MCVTDRHDMTLTVKVALNPNATDQHSANPKYGIIFRREWSDVGLYICALLICSALSTALL